MPAIIWVKKKEKKAVPPPDVPPPDQKKTAPQTVQVTVVKIIDNVFGRKKKPAAPPAPKKKSQRTTEQKQEIGTKALAKLKNVISSKSNEQKEIGDQLKDIKVSAVEAASYKEGKGAQEIEQLEEQGQAIISVLKEIPKKKEESKKLYEDIDEDERKKRLEDIYLLIDSEDADAAEASRPKWMFKTIPTGSMATLEELFGFIDLSESSVLRWKLEGLYPVRIEDEDDHEFCSSDCYIVLNIPEQDAKSKMLTLHYWMGKDSSMDKQCLCAMRSVQLNSFIRGRAKHIREEEGNETIQFLELFRGEMEIVEADPMPRPLKALKKASDPPILYRFFTFEKKEYMQKIPLNNQAFAQDAVLLLISGDNLFQWNGSLSPSKERYRCYLVAKALKFENTSFHFTCLDEGMTLDDYPSFSQPFLDAQPPKEEGEEQKKDPVIPTPVPEKQEVANPLLNCMIYRFERDSETGKLGMKTAWEGKSEQQLQKSLLSSDFVFLLDFFSEIFIWRGSKASIRDQQTALILATKLKTTRDSSVTIKSFVEGTESLLLKLKFSDWVSLLAGNSKRMPSSKANVTSLDSSILESLLKDRPAIPTIEAPQGTYEVYMFSAGRWGKLRPEERGEFYSGNPHFILYSYPKGLHEKQRYLAYFWQGKECDFRSWSSFSLGFYPILSAAIGKKGGSMTKTLIQQQAEPAAFMKLFQDQIIIYHGKKEAVQEGQSYRLYRVRTEPDDTSYIVQISVTNGKVAVQDRDTLILQTDSKLLVWRQKNTKHTVVAYAIKVLQGEREVEELPDTRSAQFWSAMSGADSQAHLEKISIPRLFSFSYVGGALSIDEMFKITQENFVSANCYLLATSTDVFCWIGGSSIPSLEGQTILYAEAYAKKVGLPFHIQREGSEEPSFIEYFNPWSNKSKPVDPQIKRDENFRKLQEHETKMRLQSELAARKAQIERLRRIEEEKERIRKELEAAVESERKEAAERELKRLEEQRKKWEEEEKERIRKEEEERLRQEEEESRKREQEAEPDEDYFSILSEGDERLAEGDVETEDSAPGSSGTGGAPRTHGAQAAQEATCQGCQRALGEKVIEVLGGLWHPHCFLCTSASCRKSLTDGFVLSEKDQKPYCPPCYAEQAAKQCAGCSKLIGFHDKTLTACEKKWHVECFVCTKCKKDLSDGFIEEGGMPYCDNCEEELFSGTCARCQKSLGSSSIQALDQSFHRDCFTCVKCSGSLDDGFIDHEDELYCENCYESIFSRPCTRCKQSLKSAFVNVPDGDKLYPFHPTCITCEVCSTSLLDADFEQKGEHLFCLAHAKTEPKAQEPKKAETQPTAAPAKDKPKEEPKAKPKAQAKEPDLCWGCKKPLKNEEVKAMGHLWHPDCFVCTNCKGSLDDGFIRRDEMPYCEPCIDKLNSANKKQGSTDNCAACGKPLSGKTVEIEDDEIYHKACFVCVGCGNNFDDTDFFSKDGKLYCEECHP